MGNIVQSEVSPVCALLSLFPVAFFSLHTQTSSPLFTIFINYFAFVSRFVHSLPLHICGCWNTRISGDCAWWPAIHTFISIQLVHVILCWSIREQNNLLFGFLRLTDTYIQTISLSQYTQKPPIKIFFWCKFFTQASLSGSYNYIY